MVPCALDRRFGALAASLPEREEESFVFSEATIPPPGARMSTDAIVITRAIRDYAGVFRADVLIVQATKRTYCQLALLVLAVVFRPGTEVTLNLVHSSSDIRRIVLTSKAHEPGLRGYSVRPESLTWEPDLRPKRYPWLLDHVDVWELPSFFLSTEDSMPVQAEWGTRDTVFGVGAHRASVRLATLLLDASRAGTVENTFDLESEPGCRGVSPRSCEVRLSFPGAFGFDASLFSSTRRARRSSRSK